MSNNLTFQFAAAADFEAVLHLACQLAKQIEVGAPPLTFAQFERYYLALHAPMRLLLAIHEDRVVGMISWTLTHELYSADARVYISDVAVDSAARGQGIGKALMAEVTAWARAHNASKLGWEVWYRNFLRRPSTNNWEPSLIKRPFLTSWRSKMSVRSSRFKSV